MKPKSHDNLSTPAWPVEKLLEYLASIGSIDKNTLFWEPCAGEGKMVETITNQGYKCIGTDINDGYDFLNMVGVDKFDMILTNPPFSLKDQFLTKCYSLGKPFALLLPITALEGIKRQRLYKRFGVEVAFLPKRVNFLAEKGKNAPWFGTAFLGHKLNFPKPMVFLE